MSAQQAMFPLCIDLSQTAPHTRLNFLQYVTQHHRRLNAGGSGAQFMNKRQFLVAMVMTGYCVQNKQ
jgi:hypothetical protein